MGKNAWLKCVRGNRKQGSGQSKHGQFSCKMDMIWVNGKKKGIPGKRKVYLLRYGGRNELGLFLTVRKLT